MVNVGHVCRIQALGPALNILTVDSWLFRLHIHGGGVVTVDSKGLKVVVPFIKINIPPKMNMEPQNHPFEKEHHLPSLHFWISLVPC